MPTHDALYYPFSRCLDLGRLKQLLLLFDTITFIDPVDDEDWRAKLFRDHEERHKDYRAYRDLAACMPWLRKDDIVRVAAPDALKSRDDDLTVAATISDLGDSAWTNWADPRRHGLATQIHAADGRPCWEIFQDKIPSKIVDSIAWEPSFAQHVLAEGDDRYAWTLSYAAGSAIGINVHLAAADELGLAPVTDSRLHHELMLMKLARTTANAAPPIRAEVYADQVAQHAIVKVLGEILPANRLENLSLEEILRFRADTAALRNSFLSETRTTVLAEMNMDTGKNHLAVEHRVVASLTKSAKEYANEMATVRERLWPKVIEGVSGKAAAGTTVAGLAASYISGSGYVLAASILLYALQPIKAALDWRADLNKIRRTPSSAVAYLSQVQGIRR